MVRVVHPGVGSRIRVLIFYPSWILDQGVNKAPDSASKECVSVSSIVPYVTVAIKLMKNNFWYLSKSYKKAFLSNGNINDIFTCQYPSKLSLFKTKRY
jgi:hypothetical protein